MYWLRHSGVKWAPRCSVNFISLNWSYLIHRVTYKTLVTPASQTKLIIHNKDGWQLMRFRSLADCSQVLTIHLRWWNWALNQNGGHQGAKCDPWNFSFFFLNMSSLKFLSHCRYIASPFANVQDLSWRLLVRKLGVHLCFTSVEKTFYNPIQDATNTRDGFSGLLTTKQDDRPLIVQVRDLLLGLRSTVAPWV